MDVSPKRSKASLPGTSKENLPIEPQEIIADSTMSKEIFEKLLMTYYTPMEIWYIRTTIEKVVLYLPAPYSFLKFLAGS